MKVQSFWTPIEETVTADEIRVGDILEHGNVVMKKTYVPNSTYIDLQIMVPHKAFHYTWSLVRAGRLKLKDKRWFEWS